MKIVYRSARRATGALLSLTLALLVSPCAVRAGVETSGSTFTATNGNFRVELSTTGGQMLRMAYRDGADAQWQTYDVAMFGEVGTSTTAVDDMKDEVPVISHVELGEHLIVKYSVRHDGLYWTFWFDLAEGAEYMETSRFIYGEDKTLSRRGAGVVFAAPGYTATTGSHSYSVDDADFSGGYADFQKGTQGLRVMISNMDDQTWETRSEGLVLWYRRGQTTFGTKIDYKRMVFVPYQVGESLADYEKFMRQHVFDHDLTNVELVSGWIVRNRDRNGAVRDWFNATNFDDGFTPGTGSSYVNKSGFWRDDWTTAGIMRQLRDTYNITRNPFYFMRMVDISDYQIDRDTNLIKSQWGATNSWQENYLMGRPEVLIDIYELTGWEDYKNLAVDSLEWYFEVETYNSDGSYSPVSHNYSDMAYCFEGLYRANAYGDGALKGKIDAWYSYLSVATWNESKHLYKHLLNTAQFPWARGHGWWFETFSPIMDWYAGSNKATLMANYRKAADKLLELQNGVWHKEIDNPSTILASCGGTMIASGMALSFMAGDLDETHLAGAMEAITYILENRVESDGVITGTDRGGLSPNPFPYTQEGFVKFAAALGIAEIVSLADRSTLYTSLNDGVFITDETGGTVTDSNGAKLVTDGPVIVRRYSQPAALRLDMELMGMGERTITLPGFAASGTTITVSDTNVAKGIKDATTAVAATDGSVTLTIDLQGHHYITLSESTCDSPWCGLPTYYDGYIWDASLGIIYVPLYPFVWSADLGWTWVPAGQTLTDLWAYSYDDAGWLWTSNAWSGWVYHAKTNTWQKR